MFKIVFEYDEAFRKWEVFAEGAANSVEALQGFNAVLITAQEATPRLECNRAEKMPDGRYHISVGVLTA